MTARVINLKRARKTRTREARQLAAAQNRVRFGQPAAERASREAETARLMRQHDGARREDARHDSGDNTGEE